jgi:hypothetical protein
VAGLPAIAALCSRRCTPQQLTDTATDSSRTTTCEISDVSDSNSSTPQMDCSHCRLLKRVSHMQLYKESFNAVDILQSIRPGPSHTRQPASQHSTVCFTVNWPLQNAVFDYGLPATTSAATHTNTKRRPLLHRCK